MVNDCSAKVKFALTFKLSNESFLKLSAINGDTTVSHVWNNPQLPTLANTTRFNINITKWLMCCLSLRVSCREWADG